MKVLNGYEGSTELSFMLVGHTKYDPNRYFGSYTKFHHSSVLTSTEVSAIPEQAIN